MSCCILAIRLNSLQFFTSLILMIPLKGKNYHYLHLHLLLHHHGTVVIVKDRGN